MPTTQTVRRVKLKKYVPEFYAALVAADEVSATGLDENLADLVRIRASQLNGCSYCVDMHTLDIRHRGEAEQKVHLISVWREALSFFSAEEQAALELTEAVTLLSVDHVPDEVYERVAAVFDEQTLSQLIALTIMINAWNRVGVTTRIPPGHHTPGA